MLQDEQALREGLAKGSRAAMEELVRQLERPLLNFLARQVGDHHAAEDLFQETCVRVMRHARDFRPKAKLSTWIFTIARNLAMDHLRARKRRREVALVDAGKVFPFSALEASDESRRLSTALATLSRPKRDAVALRFFADRSYEEIAEICGAPVGTVKFRVHQAIKDLAAALGAGREERRDAVSASG